MRLSTKYRYGSRAILEIAKNYEKGAIKRKELVKILEIPDSYLENILVSMRNGGLISTTRGARGGYVLAIDPAELTLYDVIDAMGGNEAPVRCLDNPDTCSSINTCSTRKIWARMKKAMDDVLKELTLKEMLEEEALSSLDYII
jgi:Rrf2 family protein